MDFDPAFTYRMPVAFGPLPGPRQTLSDSGPRGGEATLRTLTLRYETTPEALRELLPPCFEPAGEPFVTVEYTELSDVPWLAGRGYDTFAVKLPARFDGRRDRVTGSFVAVVWENMADPIITGREELGYAKLYADLRSAPEGRDGHRCTATWDGHVFAEMEVEGIAEVSSSPGSGPGSGSGRERGSGSGPGPERGPGSEPGPERGSAPAPVPIPAPTPDPTPQAAGVLNFRYLPGVGADAEPDSMGPVLTPAVGGVRVTREATGTGRVRFVKSTWEQLPTFYPIVNTLERLPVLGYADCVIRDLRRDIENRGQRRLV